MPTRKPSSSREIDSSVTHDQSDTHLRVRGTVPTALSGMYVHLEPDRVARERVVRSLRLHAGRASLGNRWVIGDAAAADIIAFGGSILALGDGALAHELSIDSDTSRPVDLAGTGRSLVAHGQVDPITGELHLLTSGANSPQLHVTVSRGGLTRTIRSVDGAPNHIGPFAITRDDIVLLAGGFVGLMGRANVDPKPTWFEIDTAGRNVASAHAHDDMVIVYVDGPSLERWTMHRRAGTVHRKVLDPTPQTFARNTGRAIDVPPRFLWTVGAGGAYKHDVRTGEREPHDFGRSRHARELVLVPDIDRSRADDAGWLVGIVHDEARNVTVFVVLDAQFIERPAIAAVRVPWRVPDRARGAWLSATQLGTRSHDSA